MFRITPEARKTKKKQDKHILFFAVSKTTLLCDTDTLRKQLQTIFANPMSCVTHLVAVEVLNGLIVMMPTSNIIK